jgi:hypothetical protein
VSLSGTRDDGRGAESGREGGAVVSALLVGGALAPVHAWDLHRVGQPARGRRGPVAVHDDRARDVRAGACRAGGGHQRGAARSAPVVALAGGGAATGLLTLWVLTLAATEDLSWSVERLTRSIGSAAAGQLVGWLVQGGTPERARTST